MKRVVAVLWREAREEQEVGTIFIIYANVDYILHKSYEYDRMSSDELNNLCPLITNCLMLELPQWKLRILGDGHRLIINSSVMGIFDSMYQESTFHVEKVLCILHNIALREDIEMLLDKAEADSIERFVEAHEKMYKTALDEIRNGRKLSHWIWYIFPQIGGLGHSPNSQYYGIETLNEAKAFLNHPLLGAHLREITEALLIHKGMSINDIMRPIDVMKLRSSMTLFDIVSPEDIFNDVLSLFFSGKRCVSTRCKFIDSLIY